MNFLTNILYWISSGLLIPVIIFLLLFFLRSLFILGSFYALYINRVKFDKDMQLLLQRLKGYTPFSTGDLENLRLNASVKNALHNLSESDWHEIHSEKIIADFTHTRLKNLESSKYLMRLGPMLGLMGTLIPLGPALVGLSTGDISSMALNMQVAFATTVVGIFVGSVGYITQLIKQRWLNEDISNLEYIYEMVRHHTVENRYDQDVLAMQ
jgi:biopolymer transport protein ExbB/TolQ